MVLMSEDGDMYQHTSTEQEAVSSGCPGKGGGNWRMIPNGCRVSVWADEKVLETDSGG